MTDGNTSPRGLRRAACHPHRVTPCKGLLLILQRQLIQKAAAHLGDEQGGAGDQALGTALGCGVWALQLTSGCAGAGGCMRHSSQVASCVLIQKLPL